MTNYLKLLTDKILQNVYPFFVEPYQDNDSVHLRQVIKLLIVVKALSFVVE